METRDWLKELPPYVESTLLGPDVSRERVSDLCAEAVREGFYAVCVNPTHVRFAARELQGAPVKLVTVVGFPMGANTRVVKVYEAADAVSRGADEIDMVMNISAFAHGYYDFVKKEITSVVKEAADRTVKVIIEGGLLTDAQKVRAAELIAAAGAAFVKTSTGYVNGAKEEDVRLLKEAMGDRLKIKAAGGIRSCETAIALIKAGADRLGTSTAGPIMDSIRFKKQLGKL